MRVMWCALVLATVACRRHDADKLPREESRVAHSEDEEDDEERDTERDNYWRVRVVLVGEGTVSSAVAPIACVADDTHRGSGDCGPRLIRFKERQPPLLRAIGARGWRFDHWESMITRTAGSTGPRTGRMPDGRLYLNGLGYVDTGELETVTAVFKRSANALADDADVR